MKKLLVISILALILYKMAEPWLYYRAFVESQEISDLDPALGDQENGYIHLTIPFSLPYTTFFHSEDASKEVIQKDGHFYNIVERHYSRDTLSVKLKVNESARENFDAFSEMVKEVVQNKDNTGQAPAAKNVKPPDDLFKQLIFQKSDISDNAQVAASNEHNYWTNEIRASLCYLSITSPPPERV